jgi:aminoglycoside 3-N-acetyltransferase
MVAPRLREPSIRTVPAQRSPVTTFLFKHDNHLISTDGLKAALVRLEADKCDVLYIHSGMQFGMPNLQLGRSGVLESLADVLYGLRVPTMLMPTYTFSFCNGEVFDRARSPSSMGALNEHMRVKHQWMRSCDPLMSNILHGQERGLLTRIGKQSVGEGSTFDLLARSGLAVKFLFLGPRVHECFTYMHYLEATQKVPYRYNFTFTGRITDGLRSYDDAFSLFIRDEGVHAGNGAKIYENMMIERRLARFEHMGDGSITVLDLQPAHDLYRELLYLSPSFFIEEIYGQPIRPSVFKARRMVAL